MTNQPNPWAPWSDAELEQTAAAQVARAEQEVVARHRPPVADPPVAQVAALRPPLSYFDGERTTRLTPATVGVARRTRWLWEGRFPIGTLGLLAGPGGVGKSTISYWLAAQITQGTLPGELLGKPRAVLICSAEDAWEEVALPRLLAAGADLTKVFRVDPSDGDLRLPRDLEAVRVLATEVGAALLILDPIISRLGKLDTHKDSDTRQALEPLTALAGDLRMAILGLIHFTKAGNAIDLVDQVMGSRAFSTVARSVHAVIPDREDETGTRRLFGTPKNNNGPDTPTLAFSITSAVVATDPLDGTNVTASQVVWLGDSQVSLQEAFQASKDPDAGRAGEVGKWLQSLLDTNGGCITAKEATAAAGAEGISRSTLARARQRLHLLVENLATSPRQTLWTDPRSLPENVTDEIPAPTAVQSSQVVPDSET